MKFAKTLFLILTASSVLTLTAQTARAAKPLCVVALLKYQEEYQEFTQTLERGLNQPLASISKKIDLVMDQPQALKSCLEGDYSSVVLVAHSALIENQSTPNQPLSSLLYYKTTGEARQGLLYPDQIFQNVKLSKNLRNFAVATCHSEILSQNYPYLFHLFKVRHLPVQYAEADVIEEQNSRDLRYRSFNSAVELIKQFYQ